ncbi:MAG: N-acetylneuraminate synthase [Candidatus Marinimicrobia bacterium]|nr:N-acetylneuraminate synthase [Candidatus Neomarinimicrobiota bacterium]
MKRLSTAIIAEAGVNHNGSIATAKKMIDAAAEAGADLVKFQTFKAEALVIKSAEKTEYQKEITGTDESQFEMIKKLELDRAEHEELIKYCASKSIRFLSTAFDHDSIDLLTELSVPFFKIPSGEITNLPYLRHIGRMGKPIIMSTGMATLDEVRFALKVLLGSGAEKEKITILHCNTEYPTPMEDVNLNAMLTIQDELEIAVGYSDHTLGIEVSVAAVALGATVIEKHFTLDRTLSGPDHAASLEPHELKAMVTAIRNIEKAKGDGVKRPSKSETNNIPIARKSIVAKKTIIKGEAFSESNLAVKRPGTGISPMEWDAYMDRSADREYQKDDLIQ